MKYIHVIKKDSITWIVLRNTNLILIVITFQLSVDNYSDESSIDETLLWVSVIIKHNKMKRIIKSVELHKYSVIVTTKSNVRRVYQFTNQQNKLNYYNDLVREMNYDKLSWQRDTVVYYLTISIN